MCECDTGDCAIFTDKVCSECSNYNECVDRGMNFVTMENEPEEGYPECFRCAFLVDGVKCLAV